MADKTHIVIHHSATVDSRTFSWGAIRRYHMETLGWSDIGYHAGVELVNDHYEQIMGRDWFEAGAHTKQANMNTIALGFCLVGNYDIVAPPKEGIQELYKLIEFARDIFDIPKANIKPHSFYADYKTCPGTLFDFETFLKGIPE